MVRRRDSRESRELLRDKSLATVANHDEGAAKTLGRTPRVLLSAANSRCESYELQAEVVHEVGEYDDERAIDVLTEIPLVSFNRAKALWRAGIKSVHQLSEARLEDLRSNPVLREWAKRDVTFFDQLPMILYFAKAKVSGKPIIVGKNPEIERILNSDYCFVDLEYEPAQPFIFIGGVMERDGTVWQGFAENEEEERRLIEELARRIKGRVVVTYAGKAADFSILEKSCRKYNITPPKIAHVDLFYDVILTYRPGAQIIYLPLKPLDEKSVARFLGYREPEDLKISDGLMALFYFRLYLSNRDQRIMKELLRYNRADLERIKTVFEKIVSLMREQAFTGAGARVSRVS